MKKELVVILMAVCMLAPTYALADEALKQKYTDDELIQIFKEDGYSAVGKIRDGAIKIKIDGRSYVIFNRDDGDLQAYYGLADVKISYEDINEWNRTKCLSRAYLDSSKDAILESDLLSNAGISKKHITEFFNVFKLSVSKFRSYVINRNKE